jgi:hypothetical protein
MPLRSNHAGATVGRVISCHTQPVSKRSHASGNAVASAYRRRPSMIGTPTFTCRSVCVFDSMS